jgi:protocatechuate 3,4-dioxygenase beta subunit
MARRRFLRVAALVPMAGVMSACARAARGRQAAPATTLAPTPACDDGHGVTAAETEGPYFKPSSPAKSDLRADVSTGTPLTVSGTVLDTACKPVGKALIDVWHADAGGNYDNQGYRLRGHFFADDAGRWRLDTIVPGLYTGRTRHIHVKVQAPGGPVLTTQLYFPGEPANDGDSLFRRDLLIDELGAGGGAKDGTFTFVVRV